MPPLRPCAPPSVKWVGKGFSQQRTWTQSPHGRPFFPPPQGTDNLEYSAACPHSGKHRTQLSATTRPFRPLRDPRVAVSVETKHTAHTHICLFHAPSPPRHPLDGDQTRELEDPALCLLTVEMSSLNTSLQPGLPCRLMLPIKFYWNGHGLRSRGLGPGRPQAPARLARLWASPQGCVCPGRPPPWHSPVRGEKRRVWIVCVLSLLSQKSVLDVGCVCMRSNRWVDEEGEPAPCVGEWASGQGPPILAPRPPCLCTATTVLVPPSVSSPAGSAPAPNHTPPITKVSAFVGWSLPF